MADFAEKNEDCNQIDYRFDAATEDEKNKVRELKDLLKNEIINNEKYKEELKDIDPGKMFKTDQTYLRFLALNNTS